MKREAEKIKKRQKILLFSLGCVVFFLVMAFTYFTSLPSKKVMHKDPVKIDLPGSQMNPESLRLSSLETKNDLVETKMQLLEQLLSSQREEEVKWEIEKRNLEHEIEELKLKFLSIEAPQPEGLSPPLLEDSPIYVPPYRFEVHVREENATEMGNVETTIPAGTTAKAILLSSLDAPCGVQTSADPHPVKLRILADGKLPKGVQAKLKGAILIGSAYGNLSSERVYVRIERMTQVKPNGDFIETDVTGFVSGEDGKYGVRGSVVDRSNRMIASAAAAGVLDGINQYLQATINAQTLAKATQGLPNRDVINLDVLTSSSLNGVCNGLDKLSDYFIRRAEQLQPVIQIAAGRMVDITFTHSTEVGDLHTKDKLTKIREKNHVQD